MAEPEKFEGPMVDLPEESIWNGNDGDENLEAEYRTPKAKRIRLRTKRVTSKQLPSR